MLHLRTAERSPFRYFTLSHIRVYPKPVVARRIFDRAEAYFNKRKINESRTV